MSQNKYITISMVMCLVLCGVLCFLGTPLLKVQAETIEYTENVKVRHNQQYEPTNPVVIPEEYTDYFSFGYFDNQYITSWSSSNGIQTAYFYNNFMSISSASISSSSFVINDYNFTLYPGTYTFSFYLTSDITPTNNYSEITARNENGVLFSQIFQINPGFNYFTFTTDVIVTRLFYWSNYPGTYSNIQVLNTNQHLTDYYPYLGIYDTTLGSVRMCHNVEVKGINNNVNQLTFVVPSSYVSQTYSYIKIVWLNEHLAPIQASIRTLDRVTNVFAIPSTAYYIYFCFAYYDYAQQLSDFHMYTGYSYSAQYMDDFYEDLYDYSYDLGHNAGLDEGYSQGYDAGYEDGTSVDVDTAYNNGYNAGYSAGDTDATNRQTLSFSTMIAGIFNNMGQFLSIEVFPGITIAFLIGLPLLLGAFLIILKLIRG